MLQNPLKRFKSAPFSFFQAQEVRVGEDPERSGEAWSSNRLYLHVSTQTAAEGKMHYSWCVNITPTQCERHSTEMHLICVTTEINEFKNIWMDLNVNESSLETDGWYYNQRRWISTRDSKVMLSAAIAGHEETPTLYTEQCCCFFT